MDARKAAGFTLIEIAIVLVVIGLLVGAVLTGQELIASARVRNLADSNAGIRSAYFAFVDRYRRIPGDWNATEAGEALNRARIEYQGRLRLKSQGFQSESTIAEARASVASARARLKAAQLNAERTLIRAPFAGMVETTDVELGDYVQPGMACATVVDLDPMLLVGRVSERDVHRLEVGGMTTGVLSTGESVTGPISFVGQQADPTTRTYAIEVTLPNPDYALRSGITTRINIPVATVLAHKVSPALLALDDGGAVGVRTTNGSDRVEFHRVDIVADDDDGVWVTGLPEYTTLITVGQEFVVAGERVDVVYEDADAAGAVEDIARGGADEGGIRAAEGKAS